MVSRVASSPVEIPAGIDVTINDRLLTVKGKKEQLQQEIHPLVNVKHEGQELLFSPVSEAADANAFAGTMRALACNMVQGVHQGFERKLSLVGVGYRAKAQGNKLNLLVGFSHPVDMEMPEGVTVETPSNTEVVLKGADKQKVSQIAANIRAVRPPEPYKGKGIRYVDERIIKKEGKKK